MIKKVILALLVSCTCTFVLSSCAKERMDELKPKAETKTYYFMVESVDFDSSSMYSPIMTVRISQ